MTIIQVVQLAVDSLIIILGVWFLFFILPKVKVRYESPEKGVPKFKDKPIKDRDTLDLLELVLQLHSRSATQPNNRLLHDAYWEARKELEKRIK